MSITTLCWDVTSKCNFSCNHCYFVKNDLPSFTFEQSINLFNEARSLGVNYVALTGGEPFVRKDIFDILKYGQGLGFYYSIASNASLLNEEKLKLCKQYGVRGLQFSLDGPDPKSNLALRGNSTEDYYSVLNALRITHELGLMGTLAVIMSRLNLDYLEDFAGLAEAYGAQYLRYSVIVPANYKNNTKHYKSVFPSIEQYRAFFSKVKAYNKRNTGLTILIDCATGPFYDNYICKAGKKSVYIDAQGNVFPCSTLAYPEFSLGNVLETSLASVLEKDTAFSKMLPKEERIGRCKTCGNNDCQGSCPGLTYAFTKRLDTSNAFCTFYRKKEPI